MANEELPELPKLPKLQTIQSRLPLIFVEGLDRRDYLIREMTAKVIFVMFYIGAIEGTGRLIRPKQITIMTDKQAALTQDADRLDWAKKSMSKGNSDVPGRWYAENTRESLRDESIRDALIPMGGVSNERPDLAPSSSSPRYALKRPFAALFDEALTGETLELAIKKWQDQNLSQEALTRIMLSHRTTDKGKKDVVLVQCPDGEVRRMAPGESSEITKAVIEVFAKTFLRNPALIFLSESKKKVIEQDNDIAKAIGLKIDASKVLPDVVLADLGSEEQPTIIVFVEVVATDGAVTDTRKEALLKYAREAGFAEKNIAFLTAFRDRTSTGYQKVYRRLAWGTFGWFVSEPNNLMAMHEGVPLTGKRLYDMMN
jgi:hypothetical protein